MNERSLPRDAPGWFNLPSQRGGQITDMCSLGDRLEIYTASETFMVQTPETIDPGRTNPHAPWVNAKTHDVGSSSPYVAQTLLMASEMLKVASNPKTEDAKAATLKTMHAIKETLLQCFSAQSAFTAAQAAEEEAALQAGFARDAGNRALKRFPVVPELDAKVTAFLIPARRCVSEVCQLVGHFFDLKKAHSALEHLTNNELHPTLGAESRLVQHAEAYVPFTKQLVNMRNGQEHAATTKGPRLIVQNFAHLPNGSLRGPVWFLEGQEASAIGEDMSVILENLLRLTEGMFIGSLLESAPPFPPLLVEYLDNPPIERPLRYRISFDLSRIQFRHR